MPADMGAAALSALMAEEGPIVNVVILHADGSITEKKVDMSPKANSVSADFASFFARIILNCIDHATHAFPRSNEAYSLFIT